MSCTVANISKEMTSYSDFPAPETFPVYMGWRHLHTYLKLYAEHHGLEKYIHLNTEVTPYLNVIVLF